MSTPRSVANRKPVLLIPANTRPRPSVCARSAKIGPADVEVGTGAPPSKRNVTPPLVEPIGMLATLAPRASVMKEISDAFSAFEEGMKWRPWACNDAGLFGSPDPARKSGACPGPKIKSSDILSRSPCALVGDDTATDAKQASKNSLTVILSLVLRLRIGRPEAWQARLLAGTGIS